MTNQSDNISSNQPSSRKSRDKITRAVAACERCRKRKQRCDSKLPTCGPCELAGVRCVVSDRLVFHANSRCDCASLQHQISVLQAKIVDLTKQIPSQNDTPRHRADDVLVQQLSLPNLPASTNQCLVEQVSSTNLAYSGRILRPTFTTEYGQSGGNEILGSTWNLWHNDTSVDTPDVAIANIDTVSMTVYGEELVNYFFDHYWAHLPVLHRPTFYQRHFHPVSRGNSELSLSRFQVYMVLAIAACGKRKTKAGHQLLHCAFFRRAIDYLANVLTSSDLDCVQCLLLLCMYGRHEPQSVNMWHTTGLALRTAIGIDLHRQESINKMSFMDTELAKRLFWCAYVLDRSMALAMSRPLGIDDASITMPLPTQHTDEQLLQTDQFPFMSANVAEINDTSTFIHVVKLRRLNAKIYQDFHSAGETQRSGDQVALQSKYCKQLHEWLLTAPRYIITPSMFQMPEWFQIAYHQAILNLYRPSHAIPLPSYEALQSCADSSINLIVSYASLYAKNKVSYSFIALTSIFMAAVTMLYSLRASPFVRQSLSRAVTETNINTCLTLFQGISDGREIAERCAKVVTRLGTAALALFDRSDVSDLQVDMEFLTWFGIKSHFLDTSAVQSSSVSLQSPIVPEQLQETEMPTTTPSIDSAWGDVFAQGFEYDTFGIIDFA